jgi:3-hydroxyacyl-[acyl-carrier-protein] dehydratase
VWAALENLPHREPFRFVTSVDELTFGQRGAGRWRVRGDEGFFAGHFPGNPVVPGVLLAEALAQLSGLVVFGDGASGGARAARLAQMNVKFQSGVVPPAEIRLESSLTREMGGLYLFEVRAENNGVVAASGSVVLAMAAGA